MNLAHLHLLLNHFPIIGTLIGLGLFAASFVGKNDDLKRASLMVLAVVALLALPAFFSGVGAQAAIRKVPGVSAALIDRHEGAAMLALLFMEITVALALVIGTVGILNLRMLGFAKPLPVAPLHRLMPWAMAGFGVNTLTGMLAFIGMPNYYTFDVAFWLKMLALLLLGLNVAAFYLTDAFHTVEHLGPDEDAPVLAKFFAASSLVLWFAVIALGRYIQSFTDTIPVQ